jgi:hypothetical protein
MDGDDHCNSEEESKTSIKHTQLSLPHNSQEVINDDDIKCNAEESSSTAESHDLYPQHYHHPHHPGSSSKREVGGVPHEVKLGIEKTWKEFEENLAQILTNIGSNKAEWNLFWGNMYRYAILLEHTQERLRG